MAAPKTVCKSFTTTRNGPAWIRTRDRAIMSRQLLPLSYGAENTSIIGVFVSLDMAKTERLYCV